MDNMNISNKNENILMRKKYTTIQIEIEDIEWLKQKRREIETKLKKDMSWIEFFKYYIQKKRGKKQ